jgi:hypothetical protein
MEILEDVQHRPWPVPDEPWILRQAWNELLFAHWPIARDRLREIVPSCLEIDTFDNQAWLTIAPFHLTDLSPRGLPALPWVSTFNEINVRTYVVYNGIPGVYFFSLDADSTLAVGGASRLFHLPYFLAEIDMASDRGRVSFHSQRTMRPAEFQVQYAPSGTLHEPERGTLEYWLTERYCLYTQDSSGTAYRVEIHHRPWQLQAADALIAINSMADAAGLRLPAIAPLVHYSPRQDVLTWRPHAL